MITGIITIEIRSCITFQIGREREKPKINKIRRIGIIGKKVTKENQSPEKINGCSLGAVWILFISECDKTESSPNRTPPDFVISQLSNAINEVSKHIILEPR